MNITDGGGAGGGAVNLLRGLGQENLAIVKYNEFLYRKH